MTENGPDDDIRRELIARGGGFVASNARETLSDLWAYYESMEAFLRTSGDERDENYRTRAGAFNREVKELLVRENSELLWKDYFPSELRATILISLMSHFERCLNGICTETGILLRAPVTHKMLRGSNLERARLFLVDVCHFTRPTEDQWRHMKMLQRLRNLLVHTNGMPESNAEEKRNKELERSFPGCTATEFGIDLERDFIQHIFSYTSEFYDSIASEINSACEKIKTFSPRPDRYR